MNRIQLLYSKIEVKAFPETVPISLELKGDQELVGCRGGLVGEILEEIFVAEQCK